MTDDECDNDDDCDDDEGGGGDGDVVAAVLKGLQGIWLRTSACVCIGFRGSR